MKIGKGTYGHENISIDKSPEINYDLYIGNFCSIGSNLNVYLGGHHNYKWMTTYPFGLKYEHLTSINGAGCVYHNGDVIIENDVWIGINCTIMSGVTISNGAVIAANSHVVKNVEPYSIVGGNPAAHIKYRFNKNIIDKLLEIRWWDLDDDKLNKLLPILCSHNYDELLKLDSNYLI